MAIETLNIPDIGGADSVDVIEICVAVGDTIEVDTGILVLESDKASMDVPSPKAGIVKAILVKEGDKVSAGTPMLEIELAAGEASTASLVEATVEATAPVAAAMASELAVAVPDIGGADSVDVIEVCVAVGDVVEEGDSLVVLESDKASMDIPSPAAGTVLSISLKEGDKAKEGTPVLVLTTSASAAAAPVAASAPTAPVAAVSSVLDIAVPDIGGAEGVDVIELCVAVGDEVAEGDSLVVLESDKASMEIPSPASGKITALSIKVGDKASMGTLIGQMASASAASAAAQPAPVAAPARSLPKAAPSVPVASAPLDVPVVSSGDVYAGPAVRKLALQLGVDLGEVKGTGPRGRVAFEDVHAFVKTVMQTRASGGGSKVVSGSGIPAVPVVVYAQFVLVFK